MALTSVPLLALHLAVMAIALELAAASHFRGAIIQWRPVDPDNFDGRVSTCTVYLKPAGYLYKHSKKLDFQYDVCIK